MGDGATGGPRTIYARDDEWAAWKESAWASRCSVSEYIRKAVGAYDGKGKAEDSEPLQGRTSAGVGSVSGWHSKTREPIRKRQQRGPLAKVGHGVEEGVHGEGAGKGCDVDERETRE